MNNNININLTLFSLARRCSKALYLYEKKEDLVEESPLYHTMLRKDKEVEILAWKLFKDGYDVGEQAYQKFEDFVEYTKFLTTIGSNVIYQPCFQTESGLRCRADILQISSNKKFKLYEVTSRTKIEEENILDLSFKTRVIKECFPDVKVESYIIYLNKGYVLQDEELNLNEFFLIEDFTNRVKLAQVLVDRYVKISQKTLKMDSVPNVGISSSCNNPYPCPLKGHCWKKIEDLNGESVFDISRLWETKKFQLYSQDIVRMEDIPRQVKLNEKQWQQVDLTLQKRAISDPEAIEGFLSDVKYPIYFMDFETSMHPIPKFNFMSPHSHLPFQFSVHHQKSSDAELLHDDFLWNGKSDPRISFIEKLLSILKDTGTVFIYNQKFEEARLREIARVFPKYESKIINVIGRMKDLWEPFEKRHLFHYSQKGSTSLKKVLPAWTNISYEGMAIGNGNSAGEEFEKLASPFISTKEKNQIKRDLRKYCGQDTYALFALLQVLQKIVSDSKVQSHSAA